ncbi:MAG: membrane protein insertase YidC [bacterium]|nr:membrane protein insertase YidC [bacterium]
MDRNFLLAFLLSTLVIVGYYSFFPPEDPQPIKQALEATSDTAPLASVTAAPVGEMAPVPAETPAPAPLAEAKLVTIDGPLYTAVVDTHGGVLRSMKLKQYRYAGPDQKPAHNWVYHLFQDKGEEQHFDPERLVEMVGHQSPNNRVWEFRPSGQKAEGEVVFTADVESIQLKDAPASLTLSAVLPTGLKLFKKITFDPTGYRIGLSYALENPTDQIAQLSPTFNFGAGNEPVEPDQFNQPTHAGVYEEGAFETYDDDDFETPLEIKQLTWASVMDTYFISVFRPQGDDKFSAKFEGIGGKFKDNDILVPQMSYQEAAFELRSGQRYTKGFDLYIGPKEQERLEGYAMSLPASMDLGWFSFLAYPMLAVLRWLQGYVHNWGVAIILLTFIVRALLFPLAYKGMRSMRRMAQLNPRMKYLRDKYKKDKDRLNREIMELYKKNKVNPLGGCLPLLAQVPVFIALYSALMPAIELRHQPFALWMTNLSSSDYTLILPILMGATMFIQQHLTPQPAMEPTQAMMMKWMPVLLVFFFLDMPSGLVLYWVVSNVVTVFQQMLFNRIKEAEVQH